MDPGIALLSLKSGGSHQLLDIGQYLTSTTSASMSNVNNNSTYFLQNAVNEIMHVKSLTRWLVLINVQTLLTIKKFSSK